MGRYSILSWYLELDGTPLTATRSQGQRMDEVTLIPQIKNQGQRRGEV